MADKLDRSGLIERRPTRPADAGRAADEAQPL